jgi:ABC-2 type transport system ATP-binding protein
MLKISELSKTYANRVQALKGVTLNIPAGMFGLLGPNGAGKSTLMKILATLLAPDAGAVELKGVDCLKHKGRARGLLGYLPQEFGFYPTLTAELTLDYFARLKGVSGARERRSLVGALLERVNLTSVREQRVGEFSAGMRQRLGIAQALIGRPQLLIVDEPTAGLDPEERARFHDLLAESAGDNTVVILSTHIVSDVSNLCSAMGVIRRGEIIATQTPREAVRQLAGAVWEADVERAEVAALKGRHTILSSRLFEGLVRLRVLAKGGSPGLGFIPATPTLEDYYFSLVSHTPEEL